MLIYVEECDNQGVCLCGIGANAYVACYDAFQMPFWQGMIQAFTCVIEDGRGILSKSSLHCSPLHWHCLAYLTTSYSLQLVSYHLQGIGV